MKVDVALSVSYLKQEEIQKKTVIVIDTLRTASTIITALHKGAAKVIPVETIGQALQYFGHENTILVGERYCKKVSGFDTGNSPIELQSVDVTNKDIVITTTNGTKAFQKAKKAANILVGCLLNVEHCIKKALEFKKDIVMVCVGRRGDFALEDGVTAGYMIALLTQIKGEVQLSDTALMLKLGFEENIEQFKQLIKKGRCGLSLLETDQKEDLDYCLQPNLISLTGHYENEVIVPLL